MRIAIADDDPFVRMGLRAVLAAEPGWEVVAEAGDGEGAVGLLAAEPALILMDVRMPWVDGIEATRRITARDARVRVLVLTTFEVDDYVYEALRAGAAGFLLKRTPPAQLIEAVRVAAGGEALVFPASTRAVIQRFAGAGRAPLPALSEREGEILRLLARGLSNAEIAAALFLSVQTVKSYIAALLGKLGVRDRTQAVIAAYESGFVAPGS